MESITTFLQLLIYLSVCVWCVFVCKYSWYGMCGGQRIPSRREFSLSIMWVPHIKLRCSAWGKTLFPTESPLWHHNSFLMK